MEKKKRLSLAERIAQQNAEHTTKEEMINEQKIISFISSPSPENIQEADSQITTPDKIIDKLKLEKEIIKSEISQGQVSSIKLISTQDQVSNRDQVDIISTNDQVNINIKSISDQENINLSSNRDQVSSIKSISTQDQVSSIRSISNRDQVDTKPTFPTFQLNEILLAPLQQKTYAWFLNNGVTGAFNKFQIHRDIGIPHPTLRKSVIKLESLGLITLSEYDPTSRQQRYTLNLTKKVNVPKKIDRYQVSSIKSISTQDQVSSIRSISNRDQVDTKNTSYMIDRKIFNNLSIYVDNSDFWKGQGLTLKKCEQWIEEIPHCNPEFLLIQLQFGECTDKVVTSDKPISYFWSCLMKGGLERPKGFEFPAEKAARIKQLEFEALQKALSEQENFRQKQKEIADKQAFLSILSDKEAVDYYISEIEQEKFVTPTTKNSIKLYRDTGQIDSKLERALERKFSMSDGK